MYLPILVWLEDGRKGLLTAYLDIASSGFYGPYVLEAFGKCDDGSKPQGSAYQASQIILPEDLHKHLVRATISATMSQIADRLAENRDEIPEFSAYVSAEGMKNGRCDAEELTQLADCLERLDFDDDEDEAAIPKLRELASVMRESGKNPDRQDKLAHTVVVNFKYGQKDLSALFEAQDKLLTVIDEAQVGKFDGNEIAVDGSDGSFFMYGPDADAIFNAIRPTLKEIPFMSGASVYKVYDPPQDGIRDVEITLEA